jgi:hypothetical protein
MLRLQEITGHKIGQKSGRVDKKEKVRLMILYGPDELFAAIVEEARSDEADEEDREWQLRFADFIERWRFAPSPCAGRAYMDANDDDGTKLNGEIIGDIVAIKKEIPPELFETCVEEELAQSMGLMNDDPKVRPSIFNDDQEFALLTTHDEYLLRILYDDRLKAGMTPEVAMPIVRQIVAEMLPES